MSEISPKCQREIFKDYARELVRGTGVTLGRIVMQKINFLQLEALKLQHQIAVDEMLASIDNALKMEIMAIEAERDKNG